MGTFYTDVIRHSPFFLCPERVFVPELLEPGFRAKVLRILAASRKLGVDLRLFESYRSQARQSELFKRKTTQLRTVGVHHFGLAADLVRYVDGKPNWDCNYSFLRQLASNEGLVWGGDWGQPGKTHGFVDEPHVQAIAVKDQSKLFSGAWYPDAHYQPL